MWSPAAARAAQEQEASATKQDCHQGPRRTQSARLEERQPLAKGGVVSRTSTLCQRISDGGAAQARGVEGSRGPEPAKEQRSPLSLSQQENKRARSDLPLPTMCRCKVKASRGLKGKVEACKRTKDLLLRFKFKLIFLFQQCQGIERSASQDGGGVQKNKRARSDSC